MQLFLGLPAWDRYRESAGQLLDNFSLCLVTVLDVFEIVHSDPVSSFLKWRIGGE